MRAPVILMGLAASAVLAASAAAAPPASGSHHTAAGTAAARRALLRAADLGAGWSATTTPRQVGTLTCAGAARSVAGVVETGSAISPTYRQSSVGPFLSQTTYVYGSAAQASRYWRHVSGPAALSCLAGDVAAGTTKDVSFVVTQQLPLAAPAGRGSTAYRVVGTANASMQEVKVYVDVALLLRGNAITEISWSSFSAPVGTSLERRVARLAATRL